MKTSCTVPTAPGALPLLGHSISMLRNPLQFLTQLPHCGPVVRVRVGRASMLVVCDPDMSHRVLREDRLFDKGGPLFARVREVGGDGLASCPHSLHRRQRRQLQPVFRSVEMPEHCRHMVAQIAAVIGCWHDGQEIDVPAEAKAITTRTAAAALFSHNLQADVASDALVDLTVMVEGMFRQMVTPPPLDRLLPRARRYKHARARLRHAIKDIVSDHQADRCSYGSERHDLLSTIVLAAQNELGIAGMSNAEEVCDQVVTFFVAGSETSSNAIAWALWLVARHPEVAERLHDEVDTVLAGSPATFDHLPHLELARKIITETLRLYPPIWMATRIATADTTLGDYAIPAGTTVVYSPYLIHHHPGAYQDADRFDPDRWTPRAGSPPAPRALIPFGGGPRKCIGDQFAMAEATLALATIVARWRLTPVSNRPVRPVVGMVLSPRRLRMRVAARAAVGSPSCIPSRTQFR